MDERELTYVRDDIAKRLSKNHIVPVTRQTSLRNASAFVASPLGAVPKSNGKLRTIHHLSFPRHSTRGDTSVNAGIAPEHVTMRYEGLQRVFHDVRVAIASGRPTQLWKTDLEDAFRHCIVGLLDVPLLGFAIDGRRYTDCALTFGCRSSPFLFNLYAEALHWTLESFGISCSHYLDDFFGTHR